MIIVRSADLTVDDDAYEQYVDDLHGQIAGLGGSLVASIASYYQTGDESLVSGDRHTTILPLVMAGGFKEAESNIESVLDVVDDVDSAGQIEVFITGESTFSKDFVDGNQEDAVRGEAFGVPIALIILAGLFGALAAAILPVVLAVTSIVIAFGAVLLIGQAIQIQSFAQNLITIIGLAVGIDYSLFIVSRFREERARGLEKLDAISKAGGTASRAVLFSGDDGGVGGARRDDRARQGLLQRRVGHDNGSYGGCDSLSDPPTRNLESDGRPGREGLGSRWCTGAGPHLLTYRAASGTG